MALLSVIRRWHFRDHISIREIGRRTGLSRNTIRKYLRLDGVEPSFKVPERPSKIDPFADRLSAWLRTEAKKNRKQRRNLKQLHADLMSLGYEGSYGRVAAFAREWKADLQRESCRPLDVGRSFRWPLIRVRLSSSTGRKTGQSSAMSAPNCRWPIQSLGSGPID
jgi:hypothetical protein